jgi:CubicO group peptidase (beta-lactamase class C family)
MVYSGAVGIADRKTGEAFTTRTPCYIGSLSKQFTAVGIAQLKENGLLAYSDPFASIKIGSPSFVVKRVKDLPS